MTEEMSAQLDRKLGQLMCDTFNREWIVEPISPLETIHLRILRVITMLIGSGLPVTPDVVAIYFCCDADFADWGGLDRLVDLVEMAHRETKSGMN